MTKRHAAPWIIIGSALSVGARFFGVRATNPGGPFREAPRPQFRASSDNARVCPVRRCGREFQPGLERGEGPGLTGRRVPPFHPLPPA